MLLIRSANLSHIFPFLLSRKANYTVSRNHTMEITAAPY